MHHIISFIAIAIILLLPSCGGRSNVSATLDSAETLMETDPDSALFLLEQLDTDSLTGKSDRALYAMLFTEALDKNQMKPTDDSLISIASDYYDRSSDNLRQVISNYYHGRVHFHNGNYNKALVTFFKSKRLAEESYLPFWAGMSCRGISDIYNESFNSAEEVKFALMEYDYIRQSGKQPYLNYALSDLAGAYINSREFDKASPIIDQMVDSAMKWEDANLYYMAQKYRVLVLLKHNDYSNAESIITEICQSDYADTTDSLYLSLALAETGRVDEAATLLNDISDDGSPIRNNVKYIVYHYAGNTTAMISQLEYIDSVTSSIFTERINSNLTGSLVDYFELNSKLEEARRKASQITAILISFCLLILFSMAVFFAIRQNRRNKKTIEDKVVLAEQLQESLKLSNLKNSEAATLIKELSSSQYELLEQLIEIALQSKDQKVMRRRIADTVTKLFENLSIRSEKIEELEKKVDSRYNNLFTEFRSDLPNLKEADYMLYLFSVLGLSNAAISLFLKVDNINSVYERKRRLKNKIRQLGEPQSTKYLSHL